MAVSNAQKRARDKWDAANMSHIACKLRKDTAERFKQYAQEHGTTPNALLREYIMRLLDGWEPGTVPEEPDEKSLY